MRGASVTRSPRDITLTRAGLSATEKSQRSMRPLVSFETATDPNSGKM